MSEEHVLDPVLPPNEDAFDRTLRPPVLADYVGQEKVREKPRPRLAVSALAAPPGAQEVPAAALRALGVRR